MRKIYWRMSVMVVLALTLCEASTASVFAAPTAGGRSSFGIITGSVRDSSGNPVGGALVTVLRDGINEVVKQTKTNGDGIFTTRVSPGRYLLRALADGFTPATFTAVQINPSSELVYRFNLRPAGEGATVPERRPDRHDPKFRIRANMSRRSIFQAGEGEDSTVAAVSKSEEGREAVDATIDYEAAQARDDSEKPKSGRTQGFVETYYASSANPRRGSYSGVNFAVAAPVKKQFNVIFAGQLGEFERLEATARLRAGSRHNLNVGIGGARMALAPKATDRKLAKASLGQVSVRAIDEWVVRDGVVVVLGLDYSRFLGAGNAGSLSPRLGVAYDVNARTRLHAAYAPGTDGATRIEKIELAEGAPVLFKEPVGQTVALVDGRAVMERSRRLEFGVERVIDERSSVEATAFFDTTDGRGVGLLSTPLSALSPADNATLMSVANQQGGARGLRVVYTRRISEHLKASAGYAFGRGQQLSPDGITNPEQLFQDEYFQTAAAQVDANLLDGTSVRTVLRFSPRAAVFAIDPFAGRLAVYDPSLSILVTQELPNFGLPLRAEATLDARNILDNITGIEDAETGLSVGTARRTVRGGIAVRF